MTSSDGESRKKFFKAVDVAGAYIPVSKDQKSWRGERESHKISGKIQQLDSFHRHWLRPVRPFLPAEIRQKKLDIHWPSPSRRQGWQAEAKRLRLKNIFERNAMRNSPDDLELPSISRIPALSSFPSYFYSVFLSLFFCFNFRSPKITFMMEIWPRRFQESERDSD